MSEKVIIMCFENESKAFQAFSEVKILHRTGKIKGEQMAVLKHEPNHKLEPVDFIDFTGADKSAKGSLIGMLVGILAGPLGILLGWFTGSLIGTYGDTKEVKDALSIFEETINIIPEGATGAILIAEEEKIGHLNDLIIDKLGGNLRRIDKGLVETELKEAMEAEKEAKKAAKDRWISRDSKEDDEKEEKEED